MTISGTLAKFSTVFRKRKLSRRELRPRRS
jgi:hypothetical protein